MKRYKVKFLRVDHNNSLCSLNHEGSAETFIVAKDYQEAFMQARKLPKPSKDATLLLFPYF